MKSAIALLFSVALTTGAASAFGTSHTSTSTGPRGASWSSTSGTTCANRSCSHAKTTTTGSGLTSSKNSSSSCANATCTRNASRTGFGGGTSAHTGSTTYSR